MTDILAYLQPHAGWLFGSGGLAAFVLAVIRLRKPAPARTSDNPDTHQEMRSITAGGNIAGGDVQIKRGIGALELGILASAVVCMVGMFLFFMPGTVSNQVTNGSAVVTGDGNTTTIINE